MSTPLVPPSQTETASKAQELAQEFLQAKEQERSAANQKGPRRLGRTILVGVGLVLSAAGWFVPISQSTPSPSPDRVAAGARVMVALAASRVADFSAKQGRLPRSLEEAGVRDAELTYAADTSGGFEISKVTPSGVIHYRSTMPVRDFLGDATRVLELGK